MTSSAPTGESGSNWLDRIRPADLLQTADNLDSSGSDHTHASASGRPDSESTHLDRQGRGSVETSSGMGDRQWTNIMSKVLNELFYMGGPTHNSKLSRRKNPRKQRNPKPFLASSSDDNVKEKGADLVRKDENIPAANSFNDGVVDAKESFDVGHAEEHEDKEKADDELMGYSKCEVNVIDTSCPVWKLEKLVFRKSNVWKVRDRKGKSKIFGKKKRKGSFGYDKNGGGKKKAKFSALEFEQSKGTSSQDGVNGRQISKHTREKICKNIFNDLTRIPEMSIPSSSLSKKSRQGNAAVILIKGIRASKKNGAKLAKSHSICTQKINLVFTDHAVQI